MQVKDNTQSYGWGSQAFHWGTFALFVALIVIVNQMVDMPKGPDKFALIGLHKSLGITMAFLLFARISWRMANPTPQDADASPKEVKAARVMHFALYAVLLALPMSGMIMSLAGGHPVSWFGIVEMPNLIGENKSLAGTAKMIHQFAAYGTVLMIAGHVAASLWHQFVRKDGVMKRMVPVLAVK